MSSLAKSLKSNQIEPLIALMRENLNPHWREQFTEPAPLATGATLIEILAHTLKTRRGKHPRQRPSRMLRRV